MSVKNMTKLIYIEIKVKKDHLQIKQTIERILVPKFPNNIFLIIKKIIHKPHNKKILILDK